MRLIPILIVIVGVLAVGGLSCVYIVDVRQQALVLEFGRVKTVNTEPGLYFKYPAPINTVIYYEKRILPLETQDLEVTARDNRRLVVDAFARWRIVDPQRFQEAAQTQEIGQERLRGILNAKLREELGQVNSSVILSAERGALMDRIATSTIEDAREFGVEVVDVRIRRADLPSANLQATYARMEAERGQEAAREIAEGEERARIRRAEADRQRVELVAQARRESEIIRGEADAARNRIFAQAYGADPEFFAFYRSLRAYEQSLTSQNSTLVMSPDSAFFDYLHSDGVRTVETSAGE